MPDNNPATIAERLAAAGLRVKPLVWMVRVGSDPKSRVMAESGHCDYVVKIEHGSRYVAYADTTELVIGEREKCKAACERHHAAAVLAMLEPIPSEEMQP